MEEVKLLQSTDLHELENMIQKLLRTGDWKFAGPVQTGRCDLYFIYVATLYRN